MSRACSSKSSSPRNYLFIDSKRNDQHWLLNNNTFLITDTKMLLEHGNDKQEKKVRAILYQVIKEDTNKDNRLTRNDFETIAISQYDGRGYKELVEGIDTFVGHRIVDENTLLIIYQKQGIGYSAHVRLSDFALQNERKLPKVAP